MEHKYDKKIYVTWESRSPIRGSSVQHETEGKLRL